MTFREKLKREHPAYVNEKYGGGCKGCPKGYGYEDKLPNCFFECGECWSKTSEHLTAFLEELEGLK